MNRRELFPLGLAALVGMTMPALAKCISVHDYPQKTASVPYNVAGVTSDSPDLTVETWEYQDKTVMLCRWPEMSDAEASDVVWRHFGL